MNSKQKKVVFIILILAIFLLQYNFIYVRLGCLPPHSPDESHVLFFMNEMMENHDFTWQSELNEKYDVKYFRPRSVVEVSENVYAPQSSPFYILILSIGSFVNLEYFILSITALMGVFYVYLLSGYILKNKNLAIVSSCIFSILPSYILVSNTLGDAIPSLAFWIGSIYYFLRFSREDNKSYLVMSILLFAICVAIRMPHIFLSVFFLPLILYNYKHIFKKDVLTLTIFLIPLIIFLFLMINFYVYGDFFSTGRTLVGKGIGEEGILNRIFAYGVNVEAIEIAINNYFINYLPVLLVGGVIGLFAMFTSRNHRDLFFAILIMGVFLVIYYCSNPTFYGFHSVRLQSSMSRYLLPIYTLLVVLSIYFISYLKNSKKTKIVFVMLLIISFQVFTFTSAGSLTDLLDSKERTLAINEFVVSTPEESVFIVKTYDKYIIPDREVMLMYNEEDLKEHPYTPYFYNLITEDELILIVQKLHADGYTTYISRESDKMIKALSKYFTVDKVNKMFFKIEGIK